MHDLLSDPQEQFRAHVCSDASEYLAGRMDPESFTSSVWYEAQTLSLALSRHEQADVLAEWLRFAFWEDDLDEIAAGSRPDSDRTRIEFETRAAATELLARFSVPSD